ncbi:hypothetical protein PMAYCL1PPCAC_17635, partial [Pristionchus mayeri]
MKPYSPRESGDKDLPIYISRELLFPSLFNLYLVLIAVSFTTGVLFAVVIFHKRQIFHFSFHLILLQIILCGVAKCLIRGISTAEFKGSDYLYAIELTFDFGLLLFIVSMSFNRLFVVLSPHNSFIYSNKILQCLFSSLIWFCSLSVMYSFLTPLCQRGIYEDGRLMDSCIDLFKDDFEENNYGAFTGVIFLIRRTVYLAYDFLPLSCVLLYAIATLSLIHKRRFLSQSRHSEWKVILHGLLIFVVYGISSLINYVLSLHARDYLSGLIAQMLMFIYTILDVTTVLVIPLSVFLTVPALRNYPSTLIRRCLNGNDSRVFSIQRSLSVQQSPLPPPVLQRRRRLTVASIRF